MFQENITGIKDRTQELVDRAIGVITKQMQTGNALIVAWSSGKDSSTLLNLVLQASVAFVAVGNPSPKIIITHANPGVENPAIEIQANRDMADIRAFAEKHGLDVDIKVSRPSLNTHFAVKVIGGRDLPVYSGCQDSRKCTIDWKIKPMEKMTKAIVKKIRAAGKDVVTCIGTRFDESSGRKARMEGRGEIPDGVWFSDNGDMRLSFICDWSDVDLWRYLWACSRSEFASYSDFSGLIENYRAGSNPEDVRTIDGVEIFACRFGCAVCTASGKDKSMSWMLKNNPEKYGWMTGLNKFRNFMFAIQHDLSRRNWCCFDLDRGYARLRPNTFSSSTIEELLHMALSLDYLEDLRTNGRPRFQLVPLEAVIAVDAVWSLQGHCKPFQALRIFREVWHRGNLMEIPEIEPFPKQKVGETKYAYISDEYDHPRYRYSGMDTLEQDFASFDNDSRCIPTKLLKDGRQVLDLPTTPEFSVNLEPVFFMLDDDLDEILDGWRSQGDRTTAYQYYLQIGIISLAKGAHTSVADRILRRTAFKEFTGLAGLDPRTDPEKLQEMLDRALTKNEMEAEVAEREGRQVISYVEVGQDSLPFYAEWVILQRREKIRKWMNSVGADYVDGQVVRLKPKRPATRKGQIVLPGLELAA